MNPEKLSAQEQIKKSQDTKRARRVARMAIERIRRPENGVARKAVIAALKRLAYRLRLRKRRYRKPVIDPNDKRKPRPPAPPR